MKDRVGLNDSCPPLFHIRDAVVMRAGKTILHVDDFLLAEGEKVAVLGPNGAGKSTFIKLLTREVMPLYRDIAPVVFRGKQRPTLADIKACFGVVSSSMHDQISVHLPVIDIVCGGFFGTLGLPRGVFATEEMRDAAFDVLERLGIADVAMRDVLTLSTGQARRVLVARELVHDPQVLVFDEPCTGLDPQGMYQIRKTMCQLADEGRGIVLVTHYPEDIIPSVERVVLIKDACICADGPKTELLTDAVMSDLFEAPLSVESHDGWYFLRGVF
ncbi:MAG: ATP-binding cassette domain-containing protein [Slackia sp.]|nr:ATP-binding cassette domain-containing protein [Slackia sp.]